MFGQWHEAAPSQLSYTLNLAPLLVFSRAYYFSSNCSSSCTSLSFKARHTLTLTAIVCFPVDPLVPVWGKDLRVSSSLPLLPNPSWGLIAFLAEMQFCCVAYSPEVVMPGLQVLPSSRSTSAPHLLNRGAATFYKYMWWPTLFLRIESHTWNMQKALFCPSTCGPSSIAQGSKEHIGGNCKPQRLS